MATVTFILGLAGSGKTWLADRTVAIAKFDEGFLGNQAYHEALIELLGRGIDCVVVEIAYCIEQNRQQIIDEINAAQIPQVRINWLCIENDLHVANRNCYQRKNKLDPEGHIRINHNISPHYTPPVGAIILKIWSHP